MRVWLRLQTYLVAVAVFAGDRALKLYLDPRLLAGQPIPIVGPLRLNRVENRGAAFGILPNATLFFLLITVAVVGAVAWYAARATSTLGRIALGLVLGGTLANAFDRARSGAVLDYLDVRVWPVFNLADAAISVGIAIIALQYLRGQRAERG